MIISKPPFLLKALTAPFVNWKGPISDKKIYLTFDDGPIPEITPWVHHVLKEFNAKATFFCVGDNVEKHLAIFEQTIALGHKVGNHTFHHLKGWSTPKDQYLDDVAKANRIIQSKLFRPPHGQITPGLIKQLRKDYTIVLWSTLAYDFDQSISPQQCLSIVTKRTSPRDIIVFHDSIKAAPRMQYALPIFLKTLTEEGFTFCALPDTF
jgi:peptidoglycan/xylan/chitin deacetylase (PgdA/CDA1 family)